MEHSNKVGYKNPPKQHQFKKGVSGNSKGRPPSTFGAILREVVEQKVEVTIGGKRKKIPYLKLIAMGLVKKGAEGHLPSILTIIENLPNLAPGSAWDDVPPRFTLVLEEPAEPPCAS